MELLFGVTAWCSEKTGFFVPEKECRELAKELGKESYFSDFNDKQLLEVAYITLRVFAEKAWALQPWDINAKDEFNVQPINASPQEEIERLHNRIQQLERLHGLNK